MKKNLRFFFFGFGQSAQYLVKDLINSKRNFSFCATNRKKTGTYYFIKKKFNSYKFNNNVFDKKLLRELTKADFILVSIPPQKKKDLVLVKLKETLKSLKFKKLIYLSATSVYGNHNGKWVTESSKLKGKTKFGLARRLVEESWLNLRNKKSLNMDILRVSGIYSKENNVIRKILNKNIYVKEKKYFSRIRIEDLANILKKMFFSSKKNMILNAADDKPATNIEVAKFAAKLLKIKVLVPVSISKFKNKMIKEFYKDSKKVNNKNMKKKLKIRLKYPTYKQGLKNIFDNLT